MKRNRKFPIEVQAILDRYAFEDNDYVILVNMQMELRQIGWDVDFNLEGEVIKLIKTKHL